jgi:hypothetical protein
MDKLAGDQKGNGSRPIPHDASNPFVVHELVIPKCVTRRTVMGSSTFRDEDITRVKAALSLGVALGLDGLDVTA